MQKVDIYKRCMDASVIPHPKGKVELINHFMMSVNGSLFSDAGDHC
ncbi:hypothetical protein [Methanolacinia paynteri]|nr:hypothetical protein [Methanolacinia paynteri]